MNNQALHIIGISDSHSHSLPKILKGKKADLLCIVGDWSYKATSQEIVNFREDLLNIRKQFSEIVVVNGNHELGLEFNIEVSRATADFTDTIYLENEGTTVHFDNGRELKVWGSPVTPYFGGWAWNAHRGAEIAGYWKEIPEGLDLCLIHGGIMGLLDVVKWTGEHVGCQDLRDRFDEMEAPPQHFLAGHTHHMGNQQVRHVTKKGKFMNVYNVAVCDEGYSPTNGVTEFYL